MVTLVSLLVFVFLILFIVALIAPKKLTGFGGGKPHRGKAFLYYFLPFIILMIYMGKLNNKELELAESNPSAVDYLLQGEEGLEEWPSFTSKLENIDRWVLADNSLKDISEDIRKLYNLRDLDLANNPISEVPQWMTELPALEKLDLRGTNIDSTSLETIFALREKGVKVRFSSTPLFPEEVEYEGSDDQEQAEDEHTESFWAFAERKLLYGSEDNRRLYKKGELYFEDGIEIAQVDSLGASFIDLGLFSDDKEVTAKLVKVDDLYQVKVVTIYDDAEDMTEEEEASWNFIAIMISAQAFGGEKIEVHLCDDRLNVIKEISTE